MYFNITGKKVPAGWACLSGIWVCHGLSVFWGEPWEPLVLVGAQTETDAATKKGEPPNLCSPHTPPTPPPLQISTRLGKGSWELQASGLSPMSGGSLKDT